MTASIRIMTWNVHGVFQLNPNFDIEGVCSIIRHWSPLFAYSSRFTRATKNFMFCLMYGPSTFAAPFGMR